MKICYFFWHLLTTLDNFLPLLDQVKFFPGNPCGFSQSVPKQVEDIHFSTSNLDQVQFPKSWSESVLKNKKINIKFLYLPHTPNEASSDQSSSITSCPSLYSSIHPAQLHCFNWSYDQGVTTCKRA